MSDFSADTFRIEDTICNTCKHRLTRLIIPLDYEEWGIDPNELGISDDDSVIIEQHVCLITQQDLDGIVQDCNKYVNIKESVFFSENPYT